MLEENKKQNEHLAQIVINGGPDTKTPNTTLPNVDLNSTGGVEGVFGKGEGVVDPGTTLLGSIDATLGNILIALTGSGGQKGTSSGLVSVRG